MATYRIHVILRLAITAVSKLLADWERHQERPGGGKQRHLTNEKSLT